MTNSRLYKEDELALNETGLKITYINYEKNDEEQTN